MVAPSSPAFNCDSCTQPIAPHNPRARCMVCPDYDLCANCFVGERFTNGHNGQHQMHVLKQSGAGGAQPSPTHAPQAPHPTTQSPVGWQPFFLPDMSPSSTFLGLANDLFSYLDPSNNGNLEPETYSRLLDDMGAPVKANGWKSGLQPTMGMSAESNADKTLKNIFDLFSIDHILLQRTRPVIKPAGGGFSRALRNAVMPQASHQGPMPAITRKGFIEMLILDCLSEPSEQWGYINRALRKYKLPKYAAWGDLPRSVLPQMPDPATMQRINNVSLYAQQSAERQLEAARMGAMISARANQIAVDAVGNTRTEYVYRY